jgi:protein-disulfide isomerase
LVDTYVKDGTVQFVYIPVVSSRTGSEMTVRAAYCALQEGMFWEMHDRIFERVSTDGLAATTPDGLAAIAAELGMDRAGMLACLMSESTTQWVIDTNAVVRARVDDGTFTGTPTVYVNGAMPFVQGVVPRWVELDREIRAAAGIE